MKKIYEAPKADMIRFNYSRQVVAASGSGCYWQGDDSSHYSYEDVGCKDNFDQDISTGETVPA